MEYLTMIEKSVFNKDLAASWTEFVDCPQRLKTLSSFLEKHLSKHKKGILFDAALGIGCESIFLTQRGYNVISNEIDDTLIRIANESAIANCVRLEIIKQDWRELDYDSYFFDGMFLLGNSLCLLDNLEDIRLSLKNFFDALKYGGTFIVDERNFPYIMGHKQEILNGNFRYSGKYLYCGKKIKGIPIEIYENEIRFGYYNNNNLIGSLKMYPFKKGELKDLLHEVGFTIVKQYSDFKEGYSDQADFLFYVAIK